MATRFLSATHILNVYTLYYFPFKCRCFGHQFTCLQTHIPQGVHVRSCMRSLFISVGGREWEGSASLYRALVSGVGHYFWHAEGLMYVYARTHTQTARGVLGCEPRGRDDTLGGPEESRWTKHRHICIRICV